MKKYIRTVDKGEKKCKIKTMDEEIRFRGKLLKGSRYEPLIDLSLARWQNEPKNDKGEAFLTQGMIGEVIGMPNNTYLQRDILEHLSRYPLICTHFSKGDRRGRLFKERENKDISDVTNAVNAIPESLTQIEETVNANQEASTQSINAIAGSSTQILGEIEAEHLPVTKISEKIEKNLKSEGKGQET